jgi:hypothetical protein
MTEIHLTQSPYWQFLPNPITDPLVENWETIRDQFFHHCVTLGERDDLGWVDKNSNQKPNGTTWASDHSVLYTGEIRTHSLMIRSEQLSDYEKTAIGWQPTETIRWSWSNQYTQPWLWNWTVKHQNSIGAVTFITSFPGAKLTHHWGCDEVDYTRIHVCLDEAENCVFNIEGWEYTWRNGECFGFDDGSVLHGTRHSGTKPRTILSVDILTSVIQPWIKNWSCRRPRPAQEFWTVLHEDCKKIRTGM